MSRKVLVTGAAGFIAGALIRRLVAHGGFEVVGLDLRPPERPVHGVRYRQVDMLSEAHHQLIIEESPDTVVHLAFVLNPMQDEAGQRQINVEGSRNTFDACAAAGVRQLLYLSSATAYGAHPDNPLPLTEDHPLRGDFCPDGPAFRYAADKVEVEKLLPVFRIQAPECAVAVFRPVIVYGPNVDNYLSRFLFAWPAAPMLGSGHTPIQFVHEDDVADAIVCAVVKRADGPFNIAGSEWLTLREACLLAKIPAVSLPPRVVRHLVSVMWRTGYGIETPPTVLSFLTHPWVVSTERLRTELGFEPQYSSQGAFEAMIRGRA